MQERGVAGSFVLGVFIAAGLIGMGYFISDTMYKIKQMERTVSVKGLAMKEVKADTAIFPIRFQNAAPTMAELNDKIKQNLLIIESFLKKFGFNKSEITISPPQFTDRLAQGYNNYNPKIRFFADSMITVYTKKVDQVVKLQRDLYKLTDKGVFARNDMYETQFIFTGLNHIKPQMIEVATKNARKAALKFAKDSNSALGKIKRASQGYFTIDNRDQNTPYIKKVRVVTNITYYLGN